MIRPNCLSLIIIILLSVVVLGVKEQVFNPSVHEQRAVLIGKSPIKTVIKTLLVITLSGLSSGGLDCQHVKDHP